MHAAYVTCEYHLFFPESRPPVSALLHFRISFSKIPSCQLRSRLIPVLHHRLFYHGASNQLLGRS